MSRVNKFSVSTELRNILLDDPELKKLIGSKVFPVIAPKGTEGDFILYQRDGFKQEYTKMGICRQVPIVFINAVSEDYDRSQQLAILIHEALEGVFTDPDMQIKMDDATEDYEDGKYFQVLSFTVD